MEQASRLFGNPSSLHREGRQARRAIEEARDDVAALVGARPEEIFFTSGGTEANSLAIFGSFGDSGRRVVLSGAEHPSVREAVERLRVRNGVEVVTVNPEPSGDVDPARVLDAVGRGTALVTVMAANNEYGGIFPVDRIAPEARRRGAVVHSDAVQAAGRIPVDARAWDVDLLSFSAHKLHGPKGVGALFVRKGLALRSLASGGGQERRIRPGTENTSGIVGFGVAARLARQRLHESAAIGHLRDRLERAALDRIPGSRVLGSAAPRLTNTSSILFADISGEALAARLDLEGIAVSVGSACSSGTTRPSPAILSLGIDPASARGVLRFSLSRHTTAQEIGRVIELLPGLVGEARRARAHAGEAVAV
jgi:cysteine desulfurase